jgi:aerobic carbon-monoxide dehydrogenase large subunit
MSPKGIGARLQRKEDKRHLFGRGQFTSDIRVSNLHDVAFLRSPIAHGRILRIDVPEEIRNNVVLAADLVGTKPIRAVTDAPGFNASDYPLLADDKVLFVGQPIAMCIARSRAEAEDMAQQIDIEFEEFPAVVDMLEALEPDSPLLHESWGNNLFLKREFEAGDLDQARREATVVVEREYRLNRQAGVSMEGRAILAYWDDRLDELMVYNSTQMPHQARYGLALHLDLEERQIHVVAPDVGGGFGIKNIVYPEEIAVAAVARARRHPLRWIEDRREHLLSSIHCRETLYNVKAYADDQGRILGIDVKIHVDAGAYATWPNGPNMELGMAIKNVPGPYRISAYRAEGWTVATNKGPIGPYRGVARPGACYCIERTIDEVAHAVGREPHIVRMENMVAPDAMPYLSLTNMLYDNGDYPRSVELAVELVDLPAVRVRQARGEPDGRLVGVGFASYTEQTAHGCGEWITRGVPIIPGYESATARLLSDGSLHLLVGIQSHGQGLETTLAQVAHQELGIDFEKISVRHGDSSLCPFGMGTFASRSMVMAGGAVAKASRMLVERIRPIAAQMLQCSPEAIEVRDGRAFGPHGDVSLAEVGKVAYVRQEGLPRDGTPTLDVNATYSPPIDTGVFCYSTHAVVVAVDLDTGSIEILDYAVVEDCGTMVNPMIVDGQIVGGVAQGIGNALYEELPYDAQGQPLATTLADYLVPGATEIPDIKIAHMCTPATSTEYGMKGMGEGGAISPPAAIANAVRDALKGLGVELCETPITPRRVLQAAARADAAGHAPANASAA